MRASYSAISGEAEIGCGEPGIQNHLRGYGFRIRGQSPRPGMTGASVEGKRLLAITLVFTPVCGAWRDRTRSDAEPHSRIDGGHWEG